LDRQIIAYTLILAMALVATGTLLWLRYHSRERKYQRGRLRETAAYEKLMADKKS
jgi:hypothetical protein